MIQGGAKVSDHLTVA